MVLDTSAIVATVTNEPDGQRYRKAMLDAASLSMSAVAILETRSFSLLASEHRP
ncbi:MULTISPECIES: type II toxin-antitoxin system VapC family toxin [unclassified Bradyrhizobium]|jgi:uncharacterized protein with PIN domain|uniref:type II toxin-antitoxin system VapC family toxin n=1 Tax=unclassified Bradyrhizobium TaxID=2631580 RepID=UPI00037AA771|nr:MULTISPECIES: type II toxin-antitoxin system VapC family toxin [unclassified Bradyrhizobium]